MEPLEFDVTGARSAGYADRDIADHLGKVRGFDVSGMRKAGVADDEIVHFLTTGKEYDRTGGGGIAGSVATIGRGAVKGLTETIAAAGAIGAAINPLIAGVELGAKILDKPSPIIGPAYKRVLDAPRQISESLTYESRESLPQPQRPFSV